MTMNVVGGIIAVWSSIMRCYKQINLIIFYISQSEKYISVQTTDLLLSPLNAAKMCRPSLLIDNQMRQLNVFMILNAAKTQTIVNE